MEKMPTLRRGGASGQMVPVKRKAKKVAATKKLLPTIPYKPGKKPSSATGKRAATDYVAPTTPSRMATRTAAALPNSAIYADKPGAVQRAINRRERREERRYETNNPGKQMAYPPIVKKAPAAKKAAPSATNLGSGGNPALGRSTFPGTIRKPPKAGKRGGPRL